MNYNKIAGFLFLLAASVSVYGQNDYYTITWGYENWFYEPVSHNQNRLYPKPDTTATFKTIKKHTRLYLEEQPSHIDSQGIMWYKVKIHEYTEGDKTWLRDYDSGYMHDGDIVRIKYKAYLEGEKGYREYYVWKTDINLKGGGYKVNVSNGMDTITLSSGPPYLNVRNTFRSIALKGVDKMFAFDFHNAWCPGTSDTKFVADVNGKMKEIVSSFSVGEGVWYDMINVYIPVRFENGKVLLVQDADVQNIFNTYSGELNTWEYPKDLDVPIEELVVKVYESAEEEVKTETDENGDTIYLEPEEGEQPKMIITNHKVEYYRWDGDKLVKIEQRHIKKL